MNAQRASQRFNAARQLILRQGRELEHSLSALAASLRQANAGKQARELIRAQWALMHLTLARVVDNARESLAILAATRTELVHLMKKTAKSSAKKSSSRPSAKKKTVKAKAKKVGRLSSLKAAAKKAVAKVKTKATKTKAKAKKSASKAKATAKKTVSKGKASAKKTVSKGKAKAKKVVSKAKKTVSKAKAKARTAVKKPVAKAKAAVKKPVAKVKAATQKPVAQATAAVKKTTDSMRQTGSAFAARVESTAAPAVSAMQNITPNPFSRAFLATSKGRKEGDPMGGPSDPMPSGGSSSGGSNNS
jgi:DNA polymerase III gamma/tau subunit